MNFSKIRTKRNVSIQVVADNYKGQTLSFSADSEDVNDALVGNDHRNVEITLGNIQSSKTTNNGGLNNINMNLLNRFRRTVRYLRSGRGSNLNDSSAGVALNPKV